MAVKKKSKAPVAKAGNAAPLTLRYYGDEFIFDTVSGTFYRISPSASFILRSLQAGMGPERVAREIQSRYGIPRTAAVRDIELLRNDLAGIEALDQVRL